MKSSKVHQHATIFLFLCLRKDAFSCQTQQLGRRATIGAFPTLAFARIQAMDSVALVSAGVRRNGAKKREASCVAFGHAGAYGRGH